MALVRFNPALEGHVERYAESHTTPINQACHFVGIPALMVSSLGLLARSTPRPLPTSVVAAGAALSYGRWDARAALMLTPAVAACYAIGKRLKSKQLLTLFGVGAALHLVGHYCFEHKPPAFLKRPVAAFEAPAWLLSLALEERRRDVALNSPSSSP